MQGLVVGTWNIWGKRELLEMIQFRAALEGHDVSPSEIQQSPAYEYPDEWSMYWNSYPSHPTWKRMRELARPYERQHGNHVLLNKVSPAQRD